MPTEFTGPLFENEVRRIARARWSEARYQGAAMIDNRERDGVFVTEDAVHLLECTMLPTQAKAQEDMEKLFALAKKKRGEYRAKLIKCWFVTFREPTADQRKVVESFNRKAQAEGLIQFNALSLHQFRAELIQAPDYLELRQAYPFGSMQERNSRAVADVAPQSRARVSETVSLFTDFAYVQSDVIDDDGSSHTATAIAEGLLGGRRYLLLGEYGAGKSTTLREIYLRLRVKFLKGESGLFPILLNLRDHHGQTSVAEALIRHAERVGLEHRNHLVRAWYGGYAVILLDGFDEMAISGWQGQAARLRNLRFNSMELIRNFVNELAHGFGMIIAGRSNFFNDRAELDTALGVRDMGFRRLSISDFSETQVKEFLAKRKWNSDKGVPDWFPSRPLLLSYLAARNLLNQTLGLGLSPAEGWDLLLQRICEREVQQINVGLEGSVVRELIERLASKARRTPDGVGPLAADVVLKTFQEVCEYAPDDRAAILIQRLPGLGVPNSEDGSRSFIDRSLADAAKAGDVIRFAHSPFGLEKHFGFDWTSTMGELGAAVAAHQAERAGLVPSAIMTALTAACRMDHLQALAADLVTLLQSLEFPYAGGRLFIKNVQFEYLSLDDLTSDYSTLEYQGCVFARVELSPDVDGRRLPRFRRCDFELLDGRMSSADLPEGVFTECSFQGFGATAANNAAILDQAQYSLGLRVMLVMLRKLYLQSGNGRLESALDRGLDQHGRALVPALLQILKRENLAIDTKSRGRTIWLPVRYQAARVRQLIASPATSQDLALSQARKL